MRQHCSELAHTRMAGKKSALAAAAVVVAAALSLVVGARGDTSSDITECGSQLIGMQTCLGYVQGTAKAPTPDCCGGLKGVMTKSPQCLCILVKDRNDPQLPVKINVTRALGLPAACSVPANISACPKILHLQPNSKEAQIFKQAGSQPQVKGGNSSNASGGSADFRPSSLIGSGSSNDFGLGRGIVGGVCVVFFVLHLFLVA